MAAEYSLFLSEVFKFLQTCTLKNTYFIEASRKKEMVRLNVTTLADSKVPYIINMLGDYHELDFNEASPEGRSDILGRMYVTSIDTEDIIPFDRITLKLHPKTRYAYRVGGSLHETLLERYPSKVGLIKNILYPVKDIASITKSKNYGLLKYDDNWLEEQERASIIEALNEFLEMQAIRWDVKEFVYEDYYPMVQWASIWSTLPNLIIATRTSNFKTAAAHSTHVWEYLLSKGMGDYRSVLSQENKMFLYRNINYIIANRGKGSTMAILAKELLKQHHVELTAKQLIQNTTDRESDGYPFTEFLSKNVTNDKNTILSLSDGIETFDRMFDKEYHAGLEPSQADAIIEEQKILTGHARSTWLPTKLVELTKIPLYTKQNENFLKFTWQTLLYRISTNTLDFPVVLKPLQSSLDINLSIGEALALLHYCCVKELTTDLFIDNTEKQWDDTLADSEYSHIADIPYPLLSVTTNTVNTIVSSYVKLDNVVTLVDDTNKSSFLGKTVEVLTPYFIPNTAVVTTPIKNPFPDITEDFYYRNKHFTISHTIKVEESLNTLRNSEDVISSTSAFLNLVDTQFGVLISLHDRMRSSGNTAVHIAVDRLVKQIQVKEELSVELVNNKTTYEDWFNSNIQLRALIKLIRDDPNRKATYIEVANSLLEQIIRLDRVKSTPFNVFSSNDFAQMRALFVELCSYNVTFLDTTREDDTYVQFTPITISDMSDSSFRTNTYVEVDDFVPNTEIKLSQDTTLLSNYNQSLISSLNSKDIYLEDTAKQVIVSVSKFDEIHYSHFTLTASNRVISRDVFLSAYNSNVTTSSTESTVSTAFVALDIHDPDIISTLGLDLVKLVLIDPTIMSLMTSEVTSLGLTITEEIMSTLNVVNVKMSLDDITIMSHIGYNVVFTKDDTIYLSEPEIKPNYILGDEGGTLLDQNDNPLTD